MMVAVVGCSLRCVWVLLSVGWKGCAIFVLHVYRLFEWSYSCVGLAAGLALVVTNAISGKCLVVTCMYVPGAVATRGSPPISTLFDSWYCLADFELGDV